jgi:hypothetical protein
LGKEASVPAATAAAARTNIERRGPERAKNVTRPAFGKTRPMLAKAVPATPTAPSRTAIAAKTGTDDWQSF